MLISPFLNAIRYLIYPLETADKTAYVPVYFRGL